VETDESYSFGGRSKPLPDLAIEVILTSGSDKLPRYQVLGIAEVWFWQDSLFSIYRLRGNQYEKIDSSEIPDLAGLNIDFMGRCVLLAETSRLNAANEFRQGISKL
jgi:Uma2 family endonuclease